MPSSLPSKRPSAVFRRTLPSHSRPFARTPARRAHTAAALESCGTVAPSESTRQRHDRPAGRDPHQQCRGQRGGGAVLHLGRTGAGPPVACIATHRGSPPWHPDGLQACLGIWLTRCEALCELTVFIDHVRVRAHFSVRVRCTMCTNLIADRCHHCVQRGRYRATNAHGASQGAEMQLPAHPRKPSTCTTAPPKSACRPATHSIRTTHARTCSRAPAAGGRAFGLVCCAS